VVPNWKKNPPRGEFRVFSEGNIIMMELQNKYVILQCVQLKSLYSFSDYSASITNIYYVYYNDRPFAFILILIDTQCQSLIHMTRGYLFASDNGYYNLDRACVEIFFYSIRLLVDSYTSVMSACRTFDTVVLNDVYLCYIDIFVFIFNNFFLHLILLLRR